MAIINVGVDRELVIDEVEYLVEEFRKDLSLKLWELAIKIDRKELKESLGDRNRYTDSYDTLVSKDEMSIENVYRYLRDRYATFGEAYVLKENRKEIYMLDVDELKDLIKKIGR